jgi:hypothetical protein
VDKFWNKEYHNNFKKLNRKRANSFRDKLNIVFKTIKKSEYIHPKCRNEVINEIKIKLQEKNGEKN